MVTFEGTVVRGVIVAATSLAVDECGVAKDALGALVVLVALLSAALAPDLLVRVEVLVHCYLILLVLIRLLNDALYHCHALDEILVRIGRDEDVKRLILIGLLLVVDATLNTI